MFSVASLPSLEKLCYVYDRLLTLVGPDVPIILVGNQADVDNAGRVASSVLSLSSSLQGVMQREVSYEQGQVLADKWDCPFLECSAKTGQGVGEIFDTILRLTAEDLADDFELKKEDKGCIIL